MPKMNAIEVPQGDDWIDESPRQAIDAENRFQAGYPRTSIFTDEMLDFTIKKYKIRCRCFQLIIDLLQDAEVAELADALDSGSSARKGVGVQIPPSAPVKSRGYREIAVTFFYASTSLVSMKKIAPRFSIAFLLWFDARWL